MKFVLTQIKWDKEVDGKIVEIDLPNQMVVETDTIDDAIDIASDKVGYCIHSACVLKNIKMIRFNKR